MRRGTDIGMDLGTESIIVFVKGKGILIREPSLVAYDKDEKKIIGYGAEAGEMLRQGQGRLVAIRPLRRGVISDFLVMEKMLQYFMQKSIGYRLFLKPTMTICIPSGVTDVEKRAVEEAAYKAGARRVTLVQEPIAAALGAGLEIMKAAGNMVVDIGGTITEIAVLSLGGIVTGRSLRIGGADFDAAIVSALRDKHQLMISLKTAEQLRIRIGSVERLPRMLQVRVTGRSSIDGTAKKSVISSEDVRLAMLGPVTQLMDGISRVLESISPDLASDIQERGILLAGGGAMLSGLEEMIQEETGIPTILAEHPVTAVARGTGIYHEKMAEL